MITLRNKLYESLLDDEDDLVKDNGGFLDGIKYFLKNSKSLAEYLYMPSCYIDDQLSKNSVVKLCPCPVDKKDVPISMDKAHNYLDSIPKGCIKKETGFGKYFNGTVYIYGYIDDWPELLSIAPVFSTEIYSKKQINPRSIPEYSVLFNSRVLSALSGTIINCRIFTASFDNTPQKMVTINIKGNLKKLSMVKLKGDQLKSWDQLKNIQSDTTVLNINDTELAKNIIGQYKSNLTKENNTCLYNETSDFKEILKNFKNLHRIFLDIDYSLYKNRNNEWEIWYNAF